MIYLLVIISSLIDYPCKESLIDECNQEGAESNIICQMLESTDIETNDSICEFVSGIGPLNDSLKDKLICARLIGKSVYLTLVFNIFNDEGHLSGKIPCSTHRVLVETKLDQFFWDKLTILKRLLSELTELKEGMGDDSSKKRMVFSEKTMNFGRFLKDNEHKRSIKSMKNARRKLSFLSSGEGYVADQAGTLNVSLRRIWLYVSNEYLDHFIEELDYIYNLKVAGELEEEPHVFDVFAFEAQERNNEIKPEHLFNLRLVGLIDSYKIDDSNRFSLSLVSDKAFFVTESSDNTIDEVIKNTKAEVDRRLRYYLELGKNKIDKQD